MHKRVREAIDTIDAAIFNGDTFYDAFERHTLREMLERWERALDGIADTAAEDYEEEE